MKNFEKEEVYEVINEIYEEFVDDIIKKVGTMTFSVIRHIFLLQT